MKCARNASIKFAPMICACAVVSIVLTLGAPIWAQTPPLSLADLLIGLRSKKVSLPERNTILTAAIAQRGVTFAMIPEIEKELETTGASAALIDAIRHKIAVSAPPAQAVKPVAAPVSIPAPPDFSFYQVRADQNAGKGEFSLALADYNKSLELKSDNAVAYLGRGKAYYSLRAFDLSVKDFDKALELNPKDSQAFFNRGISFEQLGDAAKALGDYQKSVDLDATNEAAKANLKRLQDAATIAAAAEAAKNVPPPPAFVNLGIVSAANATRMTPPVYPVIAQKTQVEGKVVVDLELDDKGDVVSAKATSGPLMLRYSAEDAAKRSKFKPATYSNRPIRAKAQIIYNFSLRNQR